MSDLIERALWLANGQDDPHSGTIIELCEALTAKDADIARLREFEAGVGKFLEMLEHGYAPNIEAVLSDAMCCSGQMCGCRGASVGEYLAHLLRSDVGITRQALGASHE